MGRVFITVVAGLVIAFGLIHWIGSLGGVVPDYGVDSEVSETASLAQTPTADLPENVPKVYPVQFYLWQDGYPSGPDPFKWTAEHRLALAAYLADWNLPPEEPNTQGQLSFALEAHIIREHPDRAPKLVRVTNQDCQVWIANPQAQEDVVWEGGCKDGLADGEGVLHRTYVHMGEAREIGYDGQMQAGKAHGHGKTMDAQLMLYEGDHVDGKYHGQGLLTDAGYDGVYIFEGSFADGYPHGQGRKDLDGKISDGEWDRGCLSDGTNITWILRHALECPDDQGNSILQRWSVAD